MASGRNISLILDIETVPVGIEDDADFFNEYEMSLISKYCETEEDVYRSMCSSPSTGKIVCIGMKDYQSTKITLLYIGGEFFNDQEQRDSLLFNFICVENEEQLLLEFWKLIAFCNQNPHFLSRLISFGGKQFDVPFLLYRSLIYNIPMHHSLGHIPQYQFEHLDLLEKFFGFRKRKSLELVAKSLGLKHHRDQDNNGYHIYEWFMQGNIDFIMEYCGKDVLLTEQIFAKVEQNWLFLKR